MKRQEVAMSTTDPTLVTGDRSLTQEREYDAEEVAALADAAVSTEEEPQQTTQRRTRGRLIEGDAADGGPAALAPAFPVPFPSIPITPFRLLHRTSGRYRGTGSVQLELRVDVDGRRPLRRTSGDFYVQSGATLSYFGSFVVHSPAITVTSTHVIVDGIGTFTWSAAYPRVRVSVPRTSIFHAPGSATVQFLTAGGAAGASYACGHASPFFRTIQLEEDKVSGLTPFVSYDTSALAAPPPARSLSIAAAYAEAGIEIQVAGIRNVVPTGAIGASWSNAELHNAMVSNFSLWQNIPQWKVWLLTAQLHDLGPGLLGIMFDQQGAQRQGCAVFHASLAGTTPSKQRDQLYTCVHELGHCFNLYHSFHKQYMNPPQPNRLDSLSWMNYPWYFPGGPSSFWSQFPFQFDDPELVHLRHAFRNDIIVGGNPFGTGAALEDPRAFEEAIEDNSGLRLELRGRTSYLLGEPVVPELKLERTDLRGKETVPHLHPNFGFVEIGIRHPSGRVMVYRPMMQHCVDPGRTTLNDEQPAIYESAFIGFGDDGLYFDAPGLYQLRAVYLAPDGSRVVSNIFSVRVRSPVTRDDDSVAELLLGTEQGALFYLMGSDSEYLRNGNDAIETVLDAHGKHPLAVYARLLTGVNATREFKRITPDNKVVARAPDMDTAIVNLSAVVDASIQGKGVDNISLNFAMRTLADAQEVSEGPDAAAETAKRMLEHFRKQKLNAGVLRAIEAQVATYQPGENHLEIAERKAFINHLDPSNR
jgi:hypothetical protein